MQDLATRLDETEEIPFPMEDIIEYISLKDSEVADILRTAHGYWLEAVKKGEPQSYKTVRGAAEAFPVWGKETPEEDIEKVREFCLENSGFANAVWNNGSGTLYTKSWRGLKYAYDNIPNHPNGGRHEMDYVFLHAPATVDVRNRKNMIIDMVTEHARGLVREGKERFIIDNLASGDGDDTLIILERLYNDGIVVGKNGVYARCFDIKRRVLEEGKEKLRKSSIPDDAIKFIYADLTRPDSLEGLSESETSLILGSGDYFSDEKAPDYIRQLNSPLRVGGNCYTSNIRPHNFGNHSFMGMHGWYTQERLPAQYGEILAKSGQNDIEMTHTPLGIFMVCVGRKEY